MTSPLSTSSRRARPKHLDATFEAARSGDRQAHEALVAAARGLGAVGAYLIIMFDPEKVIITGEGRAVAEYIPAELQDSMRGRLDPDAKPLQFDVQPPVLRLRVGGRHQRHPAARLRPPL